MKAAAVNFPAAARWFRNSEVRASGGRSSSRSRSFTQMMIRRQQRRGFWSSGARRSANSECASAAGDGRTAEGRPRIDGAAPRDGLRNLETTEKAYEEERSRARALAGEKRLSTRCRPVCRVAPDRLAQRSFNRGGACGGGPPGAACALCRRRRRASTAECLDHRFGIPQLMRVGGGGKGHKQRRAARRRKLRHG